MNGPRSFATFESEHHGTGVKTLEPIANGAIVMRYEGERLKCREARTRERQQAEQGEENAYMFWFWCNDKWHIIDASRSEHISRYINHSKRNANIAPVAMARRRGEPEIVFKALRSIEAGEELLFDYGDDRRDVVKDHQWLKE